MSNEQQDNDRIEDSLDNMSNLKLRQSSLQKHRAELLQVKRKFIQLLEKLQLSETRQISLSQIKKLVQKYNESDHLKIYLSILKSLKPNHNSTTKEHEVLVISIIAKVFRSNLIDPVDKQPTLLKTCFKIVEILLVFFNDSSNTVQQACARVLLDLNEFCLQEGKYQKQQKLSVLFAPLLSILRNGVDKASQATATVCINELLKLWYSKSQKQYLDMVYKDVFSIILKINSEYHEIFMAALILIEHKGLAFFENKLPNFLSKILPIIDGTREGTNSFNAYMCKVNVCKIIQKVALLLKPDERQKLADLNILGSLSKAARNKIIQVQMAATRALKVWRGETVSEQKVQRSSFSNGKPGLRSLEQMRDQKKRQRSNSKQNTIKIQNQLNYMKEDLQKMVKGGWGANNRAKNYVKRGSGVGGGHYGQLDSATPPKNTKSHREHLQELRSMIKQGVKQNKNVDKFDFVEQRNRQKHQQQVPTSSNNNVNVFSGRGGNNNNPDERIKSKKDSGRNETKLQQVKKQANTKKQDDDDEFIQLQDEGDQCAYIPQKKPLLRKGSNQSTGSKGNQKQSKYDQKQLEDEVDNFHIGTEQAQELLRQEGKQSHKPNKFNEQLKLNFDYLDEKKQKIKREKQKQAKITKVKDEKFMKKASKIKENLGMMASMISQRQLQELMMENNLSEVSDNLSGFLNESDLNINQEQNGQQENNQIPTHPQKLENNFMKKTLGENTYTESLNFTESRASNFKSTINQNNNQNNANQNGTSSMREQQFTLNPNISNTKSQNNLLNQQYEHQTQNKSNKFQSIQQNNYEQEEIQEEIVQSYFQESKNKNDNLLPIRTKVSPKSNFSPQKNINAQRLQQQLQQQQSKISTKKQQISLQNEEEDSTTNNNYQQLIQNPPTSYQTYMDKKSIIKPSVNPESRISSNYNNQQQNNQEEHCDEQEQHKQTVTDKWIRILSLVQNDDVNSAFEEAFLLDDPIYLIRLLIITRTPISSLTAHNCSQLWTKFLDIYKHNFISILFVQLFTQANDLELIKNSLTIEEMHQLLLKLYEVSGTSKGKLSFNAALLYNKIDQSLRPNKK